MKNGYKNGYKTELEEAYFNLPGNRMETVVEEIRSELDWSKSTWYAKRSGRTRIRRPEWVILDKIFSQYGIKINQYEN